MSLRAMAGMATPRRPRLVLTPSRRAPSSPFGVCAPTRVRPPHSLALHLSDCAGPFPAKVIPRSPVYQEPPRCAACCSFSRVT